MGLRRALHAEWLKVHYSKILWISLIVSVVFPLLLGFIMAGADTLETTIVVAQHPAVYFSQYNLVLAIGGIIGFGFLYSWIFGREFVDGTATNLFALPLSRVTIVTAKFIVALLWCMGLGIVHFGVAVTFVWITFPHEMSSSLLLTSLADYSVILLMVLSLSKPIAGIASKGRSYLAPIGFVILTIVIAQLLSTIGLGVFFPWAIPALYSGAVVDEMIQLTWLTWFQPFGVGIVGYLLTALWWRYADHV